MDGVLSKNLARVTKEIEQARARSEIAADAIRIIAVSKRQSIEKIRFLYQLGIHDFAENYWQEARDKMSALKDLDISWHFIGNLQKKKVKDIVGNFHWIHSLDRFDVAEKISFKATELGIEQQVLVQVNIAKEFSKQGLHPDEVIVFLHKLKKLPNLKISGLMIFPPLRKQQEETKHWFQEGYDLFCFAREHMGEDFAQLSMGTSMDYSWAVEKGANMLRIGEALMGSRI